MQKEPLEGQFYQRGARTLSGTLLGPTNYHGYQPALRADCTRAGSAAGCRSRITGATSRWSAIPRWSNAGRRKRARPRRSSRREGEPPTVLPDGRRGAGAFPPALFRRSGATGHVRSSVHGSVARNLPERGHDAGDPAGARNARLRYPAQFVQLLRQGLQNAGLHIFKHRKRVVYVSLARPMPFVAARQCRVGKRGGHPRCHREISALHPQGHRRAHSGQVREKSGPPLRSRRQVKCRQSPRNLLKPVLRIPRYPPIKRRLPRDDTAAKAKGALAADLRFLVQAGHIIEFHNGTFDLPLPPKTKEESARTGEIEGRESRSKRSVPTPANSAPSPAASATQVEEPSTPDDPAVAEPVEQPASAASVPETQSEDAGLSDEPELSAQPATSAHDPGVSSEPLP